jgi:hypothetical protein
MRGATNVELTLFEQLHKEGPQTLLGRGVSEMKLSAPIFRLKRQARLLARDARLPLHEALDRVARREGYRSWSHLAGAKPARSPAREILGSLTAGDFLLLGARPGHGKTLLGLELAVEAARAGRRSTFFSLEDNERIVVDRLRRLGTDMATLGTMLRVDTSDDISSDYIADRLRDEDGNAFAVIDYLQLLD